jgi:hypothetical protein
MNFRPLLQFLTLLSLSSIACAEPCPKVNVTTQSAAAMRAIARSINCLIDAGSTPAQINPAVFRATDSRGTQVDTLPIIGPQHTQNYPGFQLAILSMPVDNTRRSVIVTPESPQAAIRGAGGGECKLKLNPDHTLDALCNQAGGTVFVVFR